MEFSPSLITYSHDELRERISVWSYEDVLSFIVIFQEEKPGYSDQDQLLILNLLMQRVLQFEQAELQSIKNLFC